MVLLSASTLNQGSKGILLYTDRESDKLHREYQTITCCHCNHTFVIVPGSGKTRGMCLMCYAPTCGAEWCMTRCEPFERRLEAYERRHQLQRQF